MLQFNEKNQDAFEKRLTLGPEWERFKISQAQTLVPEHQQNPGASPTDSESSKLGKFEHSDSTKL
jgi:hypothetical protein